LRELLIMLGCYVVAPIIIVPLWIEGLSALRQWCVRQRIERRSHGPG
jgi:hypothetical protein